MKRIYLCLAVLLLIVFFLHASEISNERYNKPHFAITAFYDFLKKSYRTTVYGLFDHVGVYASFAGYQIKLMDDGYAGWLYSDGSVLLMSQYVPADAKNSYSFVFKDYYSSEFYQRGLNYGVVFRFGKHFNLMTGISNMKTTEFARISYTYPTISGVTRTAYPPTGKYIINKSFYDVNVIGYEIGMMAASSYMSADFFATYYPEIKELRISGGVGVSY